ncbi:MAG: FAD-dependent oxidoreductase [Actinomycetota bacterium]|nr:FAD-dependent oxidoreductase [Actinomycetota bacterium]
MAASDAVPSHSPGDNPPTAEPFDVVVVGGGVVGCAVARLLSHHQLSVALVEARDDVGAGTSKANTAILHTGFDAVPGSVEARLVARGYQLLRAYAPTAGISVEETGAVLVAWDDEQAATLPKLAVKAEANGYAHAEVIDAAAVHALEPHLGDGITGGMIVPGEHLIDPWSTPIAFATEAVANGCHLLTGFQVVGATAGAETTTLTAADGRSVCTHHVVNAAGLHGDTLHRLLGFDGFTVRPRRGELIVFDKLARPLLGRTILPVPTSHTKGVLVAPTVFGNIMLGPTADDIDDKGATGSTRIGVDGLLQKGRRILPALLHEEVTAVYAGLRAATEHSDYQLSAQREARYVCLGGIRSTGLTAAMALAEEALALLAEAGCTAMPKAADEVHGIRMTPLGEGRERPYQRGGTVVCHCERVTAQELEIALTSSVPATDLDGLRRRTRALAGRCQGFYCSAEVCAHAAAVTGRPMSDWMGVQ